MRKNILICIFCLSYFVSQSQMFSIANENMNVFYLGIDNPISFAVEKISNNLLIVKSTNGAISKELGSYSIKPDKIGIADILIYKKDKNKLTLIAQKSFKVKRMRAPVFKIGSGVKNMPMKELSYQEFVRADMENIDFNAGVKVDEFKVQINYKDSSESIVLSNFGNKLSEEIKQAFKLLKHNDTVIFLDIFVTAPWEKHIELESVVINVK
jgi:hypothetical protein